MLLAHNEILIMFPDEGCFLEGTTGRALSSLMFSFDNMTNEVCRSLCSGYRFHGTEYGKECHCGTHIHNGALEVPSSACDYPCPGDSEEMCGGVSLLSIYRSNFTVSPPLYNYTYLGCAAEPKSHRALPQLISMGLLTRHKCMVVCSYGEFELAGVEYGDECWCGHTLEADISFDGTCDMPCSGDPSETCGGRLSLDLYMAPPSTIVTT